MKNTLSNIFIFAAGAAIGAVVTWKFVKTKYERIAQEEIDSMKEYYVRKNEEKVEDSVSSTTNTSTPTTVEELVTTVNDLEYANDAEVPKREETKRPSEPYIVSPEEFYASGYEVTTLRYWANGIYTNDEGEIVEDAWHFIKIDPEEHFGEYEDDAVHVRNDEMKTDFEILRELREYEGE